MALDKGDDMREAAIADLYGMFVKKIASGDAGAKFFRINLMKTTLALVLTDLLYMWLRV